MNKKQQTKLLLTVFFYVRNFHFPQETDHTRNGKKKAFVTRSAVFFVPSYVEQSLPHRLYLSENARIGRKIHGFLLAIIFFILIFPWCC